MKASTKSTARAKVVALLGILLSTLVFADRGAHAEHSRVDSMALAPLPPEASVDIRASEDSEVGAAIAQIFADRLTQRGFTVVERKGELILRFAVDIDEPGPADRPRLGARGTGGGKSGVSGEVYLRSGDDGGGKKRPRKLRLRASIGKPGRPPLWSGYAEALLEGRDRLSLGRHLATDLSGHIGLGSSELPALLAD